MIIKNSKVFEEALLIVINKNGKCLTQNCSSQYNYIDIICDKGHAWKTTPKSIKGGHWCRQCSQAKNAKKKKTIHTLDEICKIASQKGGKCISKEYKTTSLEFECYFKHRWKASVGNIINNNSWCPVCSNSLGERICRLYFETIFNKKFPTTYPKWLKNSNGKQLELDGYCEEMHLAFEHQGKQHYTPTSFGNKFPEFDVIINNDKQKQELCRVNNIKLILIPELFGLLKINDLKNFIKNQCFIFSIKLPNNYDNIIIDYNKVYLSNNDEINFNKIKEKLFNNNYSILDNIYVGTSGKYTVKCNNCNFITTSYYDSLIRHKCHRCLGRNNNISIIDAQLLAKTKNGECLSKIYIKNTAKLSWKCQFGHIWEATYMNVKNKTWCPICYKIKRKIL